MKPELLENSTFLMYYEKWQKDPKSVVFAAISEMFRTSGMVDDAIRVAQEGLKHHPGLISGRLALAKALAANNEKMRAREQAMVVLEQMPSNEEALKIVNMEPSKSVPEVALPENAEEITAREERIATANYYDIDEDEITEEAPIEEFEDEEEDEGDARGATSSSADASSPSEYEAWNTLTMAKILERQGHFTRARRIYRAILEKDPGNEEVISELSKFKL